MDPLTHPDEPFATNRYSKAPSPLIGLLLPLQDLPRSPCASCNTHAILSDIGFCCDCQYELTVFKALRENKPVYVLTDSLGYYPVLNIERQSEFSYSVTVTELSSPLTFIQLSDFHLSIPSLVTAGIARANDAILRFNTLHKQHLALP